MKTYDNRRISEEHVKRHFYIFVISILLIIIVLVIINIKAMIVLMPIILLLCLSMRYSTFFEHKGYRLTGDNLRIGYYYKAEKTLPLESITRIVRKHVIVKGGTPSFYYYLVLYQKNKKFSTYIRYQDRPLFGQDQKRVEENNRFYEEFIAHMRSKGITIEEKKPYVLWRHI